MESSEKLYICDSVGSTRGLECLEGKWNLRNARVREG